MSVGLTGDGQPSSNLSLFTWVTLRSVNLPCLPILQHQLGVPICALLSACLSSAHTTTLRWCFLAATVFANQSWIKRTLLITVVRFGGLRHLFEVDRFTASVFYFPKNDETLLATFFRLNTVVALT